MLVLDRGRGWRGRGGGGGGRQGVEVLEKVEDDPRVRPTEPRVTRDEAWDVVVCPGLDRHVFVVVF